MIDKQTCPHCNHQSIVYITATSCHCTNQGCDAKYITLPVAEFMALSAAQLQSYQRGHTNLAALEVPHKERTDEIERIILEAAKRKAARDGDEKVYG